MAKRATATLASGVGLGLGLALSAYGFSASAAPAGPDLLKWLAETTDMAPAQVVIAGPKYVYSLEPGPRASTGEQVALVRTERLEPGAGAASWEAHLLFDCAKARLREIRGATFPQTNRKGAASPDPPSETWIRPEAGQPAMQLLSAACDPAFAWPLRSEHAAAPVSPAQTLLLEPAQTADLPPASQPHTIVMAQATAAVPPGVPPPPPDLMPAPVASPAAEASPPPPDGPAAVPPPPRSQPQTILMPSSQPEAAPPAPPLHPAALASAGGYDVQVARGPSQDGASRALERARRTLGALPAGAFGRVETGEDRGRRRYTAILAGFPTPEAAVAACGVLQTTGQTCFVRNLPQEPEPSIAASVPPDAHAVQVARGPSEDGAKRALSAARRTLGESASGLVGAIEESRVGSRRRFTAVLAGFASGEAADAACDTLVAAGQLCLTRSPETTVAANAP